MQDAIIMITKLVVDYGWQYLATTALFFGAVKGLSGGLLRAIILPYFRTSATLTEYHAIYTLACLMPWCTKPLWGHLSDGLPVRGYRKRWYACGAAVAGLAGCLVLAADPAITQDGAAAAFTVIAVAVVVCDLLFAASYAARLRGAAVSGKSLVSFAWAATMVGAAIAAVPAGVLGDEGAFAAVFYIAAVPFAGLVAVVAANGLGEQRLTDKDRAARPAGRPFAAVLVVASCLLATAGAEDAPLAVATTTAIVLGAARLALSKVDFACALFLFACEAATVNLVGATDYFYTSTCGANFTYTFYAGCTTLVTTVFGLAGIYCYTYIAHWSSRSIFAALTCARVVVSTTEVVQTLRLNVGWGISDEALFILGEAALRPMISMMFFLPILVLQSEFVVKGQEAITYATLAGIANFGGLVAGAIGGYVTEAANIEDCRFKSLPIALVFGHMALPMAIVPLVYLVLPVK